MKFFLISSALIFVLAQCKSAENSLSNHSLKNATLKQDENAINDITAHWKFIGAEEATDSSFLNRYPKPITMAWEVIPAVPKRRPDIIIEKDSLYEINYPMNVVFRSKQAFENGFLYRSHNAYKDSLPFQKVDDTLIIYEPFYDGKYVKKYFLPTRFNDSIIDILKTHNANYPELAGEWKLIRESSGEDGSEYILEFPHDIPDTINISREEFIAGIENNYTYMMATDGLQRAYTFSYSWGKLWLKPGEWYKGTDLSIHFERIEK